MKLHLIEFDSLSPSWDEFIVSHPRSTNYHQFGWKNVIEQSFGHTAIYLGALDEEGVMRGVLPLIKMESRLFGKFLVSLPFVNYGGILCSDETAAVFLLDEAQKLLKAIGAEYVELRHLDDLGQGLPGKTHKVTMLLDLETDVDRQWKSFNAKLRNQVRKAEKSGLTATTGQLELLDGFYEVFCRNMRDLGTPVYGKDFFRNIFSFFPESTRIISIYSAGTIVASGILSWFRDTVEVPWASSIRDYKAFCPNNLLYWEAIGFAIKNGFRKFDFGRSTPNEGTYKFKEQWGAKPVQLYWQYLMPDNRPLPELNTKNPKYRTAINVWKKLPLPLTKLVGPLIVRNIP